MARAEENKAIQEAEQQNALRQQEAQKSTNKKKESAQKVFKELFKLKLITETGLSYSQYSERLIDAKTTIEMSLLDVDDQRFSSSVSEILSAYLDARDIWLFCIQYPHIKYIDSEIAVFQKYKIKPLYDFRNTGDVSSFWSFATDHLNGLAKTFPNLLE